MQLENLRESYWEAFPIFLAKRWHIKDGISCFTPTTFASFSSMSLEATPARMQISCFPFPQDLKMIQGPPLVL